MKFNPITKRLFTDDHRLLKQLHCPFKVDWNKLTATDNPKSRGCDVCQHQITDTALLTDDEVLALMTDNPEACLKVDLYQNNLTIICHDAKP